MKSFCEYSGEVINTQKSKLLFTKNCSDTISENILNSLNIKSGKNYGKYMMYTNIP